VLRNVRDVGGLDGGRVRGEVLYRSDAPHAGDGAPAGLVAWPPRTVLDLRSSDELDGTHPLTAPGTEVVALPASGRAGVRRMVREAGARGDLGAFYINALLPAAARFARAAGLIATSPTPVLVHCTAGKDRTGVLVAAVLAALGIPRTAIVADYTRTQDNMPGVLERIAANPAAGGPSVVARLLDKRPWLTRAPAEAIETVLDHLDAAPGGAAGWLTDHGLDRADLARLRERMVERA
jgi:hypothetical protein